MGEAPKDQASLETKRMRDKDVAFAIVLILGSGLAAAYAMVISFEAVERIHGAEFYTAPGFFVFIVACALVVLGVSLLVTALKQGGDLRWLAPRPLLAVAKSRPFRQTLTAFGILYLYMCVFWDNIPGTNLQVPFWFATFAFLFLMMFTFRRRHLFGAFVISAVGAGAIDVIFRYLIQVPLP